MDKLFVKQCRLGFGITNGKKWFFYAYPTIAVAEGIMRKFTTQQHIDVNVSHAEPLELVNLEC